MKLTALVVVASTFLGFAWLRGETDGGTAAPVSAAVQVGGKTLLFPAPEGFVRCDGVRADWDQASESAVPATNRRLIVFSTTSDLAILKRGGAPEMARSLSSQIGRSVENRDLGEREFDSMRSTMKAELEGMRSELQAEVEKLASRRNKTVHDLYGTDDALRLSDVAVLGFFEDKPASLGFTMALRVNNTLAAGASKNKKRVMAALLIPVNGRVIDLYATSDYRTEADRQWAENSVAAWRDAIVAANPRMVGSAFANYGYIFKRVGPAALVGAIIGGAAGLLAWLLDKRKV